MRPAPSPGFIYRLLSCILYPFWLAHSIRHGSKHSLPQYRRMRGAAGAGASAAAQIWVHASSVGEVKAVTPLVESESR